jgi:hypothetical protein
MKFTDLRTIQQIAILADIAGLNTDNEFNHFCNEVLEETSDELKALGLKRTPKTIRKITIENILLPEGTPRTDSNRGSWGGPSKNYVTFSGRGTSRNDFVTMRLNSAVNKEITPNLRLDPYGITSNIKFEGDLENTLTIAADLVGKFEKILDTNEGSSEILHNLASVFAKANALPSDVIDQYYVDTLVASRLHYIIRNLSALDNHMFDTYQDNELTPEKIARRIASEPKYRISSDYANRCLVTTSENFRNRTGYTLEVIFGADDTDEVVISYKVGNQQPIEINRYVPADVHPDVVQFITDTCNYIEAEIKRHNAAEELMSLVQHLVSILKGNAPFIARDIEQDKSQHPRIAF